MTTRKPVRTVYDRTSPTPRTHAQRMKDAQGVKLQDVELGLKARPADQRRIVQKRRATSA